MSTVTATKTKTYDLAYIAIFAVLIAICSWISIPMTVPFTLQTFGVFMAVYKTSYYKYVLHYLRSNQFRGIFDDGNSTSINQLTQDMLKRALLPFLL